MDSRAEYHHRVEEPLNWTTEEVMRELRVSSRDQLKRLRDNHGLPFIDEGGKEFVYPVAEVKAWNAARVKVKPARERARRTDKDQTVVLQRRRRGSVSRSAIGPRPGRRLAAAS